MVGSTTGRIGLGIGVVLVAAAVVSPLVCGNPAAQTVQVLQPPSWSHLLGTNDVGQDVLWRLLHGARTSLLVAVSVGVLSTAISAVVGISAGLVGGTYERVAMRVVDALLVTPMLIPVVLVSAFIQPGVWGLIFIISVLRWAGGARIVRAQTLSLKQSGHVAASRSFGAGTGHVLVHHIAPDLSPILLTSFVHTARTAVFMEAGLAFIGIAAPGMVSWGTMIRNAMNFYYLPAWKWWLVPPALALSLLILSFVLIGHSLEEVMDPRLHND
ncbi:MAG: ABC transporter permease [Planctomycetota bacterium]